MATTDNQESQTLDIDYVANLARIDLTSQERQAFASQLTDILHYIEKLSTVDVSKVQPIAHAFPVYNVWREDNPEQSFSTEQTLSNATQQRDRQLVVPKVVE